MIVVVYNVDGVVCVVVGFVGVVVGSNVGVAVVVVVCVGVGVGVALLTIVVVTRITVVCCTTIPSHPCQPDCMARGNTIVIRIFPHDSIYCCRRCCCCRYYYCC